MKFLCVLGIHSYIKLLEVGHWEHHYDKPESDKNRNVWRKTLICSRCGLKRFKYESN